MSCEHQHVHGHSHGDDDHVPPSETSFAQSLTSKINLPSVTALNLRNPRDDLPGLFKTSETRYSLKPVIRSDADEQLILHIPFVNGSVKLHSVILRTNGDKFCPKTIKFWKNNPSLDFDSAQSTKPHFTVTNPHLGVGFNAEDDDDSDIPDTSETLSDFVEHHMPRHVFTGVHTLSIFFESIYGDEEECHLHSIELRGEFTELTRDPVITLYESAPNPADHQKVEEKMQMRY